jgi:hypothetical protein
MNSNPKLNRRRVGSILGSVLALTFVVAVIAPGPAQGGLAHGKNVRWDLIQALPAGAPTTGIPGGINTGRDAATGDTIELTGSGGAIPALGRATGGGTFVHRTSGGSVFAQGFYVVTGFVSWERRTGTFPLPNDGVGDISQASAGVLTLDVRLFPTGLAPVDGVLTIHCHFPTTPGPNDEGFDLAVLSFHFVQATGVTLFHVFR